VEEPFNFFKKLNGSSNPRGYGEEINLIRRDAPRGASLHGKQPHAAGGVEVKPF